MRPQRENASYASSRASSVTRPQTVPASKARDGPHAESRMESATVRAAATGELDAFSSISKTVATSRAPTSPLMNLPRAQSPSSNRSMCPTTLSAAPDSTVRPVVALSRTPVGIPESTNSTVEDAPYSPRLGSPMVTNCQALTDADPAMCRRCSQPASSTPEIAAATAHPTPANTSERRT